LTVLGHGAARVFALLQPVVYVQINWGGGAHGDPEVAAGCRAAVCVPDGFGPIGEHLLSGQLVSIIKATLAIDRSGGSHCQRFLGQRVMVRLIAGGFLLCCLDGRVKLIEDLAAVLPDLGQVVSLKGSDKPLAAHGGTERPGDIDNAMPCLVTQFEV
jgi:hypothetical protein